MADYKAISQGITQGLFASAEDFVKGMDRHFQAAAAAESRKQEEIAKHQRTLDLISAKGQQSISLQKEREAASNRASVLPEIKIDPQTNMPVVVKPGGADQMRDLGKRISEEIVGRASASPGGAFALQQQIQADEKIRASNETADARIANKGTSSRRGGGGGGGSVASGPGPSGPYTKDEYNRRIKQNQRLEKTKKMGPLSKQDKQLYYNNEEYIDGYEAQFGKPKISTETKRELEQQNQDIEKESEGKLSVEERKTVRKNQAEIKAKERVETKTKEHNVRRTEAVMAAIRQYPDQRDWIEEKLKEGYTIEEILEVLGEE